MARIKSLLRAAMIAAPATTLVACGGGGGAANSNGAVYPDPVVVTAGTDKYVNGNAPVMLTGAAVDPSYPLSAMTWEQVAGPVVKLDNADCANSVSGDQVRSASCATSFVAPSSTVEQTLTFRLSAVDSKGYAGADTVNVLVSTQQQVIPASITANAGTDVEVTDGKNILINGTAKDSIGRLTSVRWLQVAGAPSDYTGECSGYLGENGAAPNTAVNCPLNLSAPDFTAFDPGTNELKLAFALSAQNADGQVFTDTMTVTVKRQSDASSSLSVDAGANLGVTVNDPVLVSGTAKDSEVMLSALYWTQTGGVPVGITGDCAEAAGATQQPGQTVLCPLSFMAPSSLPYGQTSSTLNFRLTAVNSRGFSKYDDKDITVSLTSAVSVSASADAGMDKDAVESSTVFLDGSKSFGATNDAGTGLRYRWELVSPLDTPLVISDSDQVIASFKAPAVNDSKAFTFRLTLTDAANQVDTDDVVVTVHPADEAPIVASAGDAQVTSSTTSVTLDASASTNPSGGAIYYQWEQVSGTSVTIANANTVQASFVAPTVAAEETLVFQVKTSTSPITASTTFATSEIAQTVVVVNP